MDPRSSDIQRPQGPERSDIEEKMAMQVHEENLLSDARLREILLTFIEPE